MHDGENAGEARLYVASRPPLARTSDPKNGNSRPLPRFTLIRRRHVRRPPSSSSRSIVRKYFQFVSTSPGASVCDFLAAPPSRGGHHSVLLTRRRLVWLGNGLVPTWAEVVENSEFSLYPPLTCFPKILKISYYYRGSRIRLPGDLI